MATPVTTDELIDKATAAKGASVLLAQAATELKNRALMAIAEAMRARESEILTANRVIDFMSFINVSDRERYEQCVGFAFRY